MCFVYVDRPLTPLVDKHEHFDNPPLCLRGLYTVPIPKKKILKNHAFPYCVVNNYSCSVLWKDLENNKYPRIFFSVFRL